MNAPYRGRGTREPMPIVRFLYCRLFLHFSSFVNCSSSHVCMLTNLTGTCCHGSREQEWNSLFYAVRVPRWYRCWRRVERGEYCRLLLCIAPQVRGCVYISKCHGDDGICLRLRSLQSSVPLSLIRLHGANSSSVDNMATIQWFSSRQIHVKGFSSVSYYLINKSICFYICLSEGVLIMITILTVFFPFWNN